jgi:hypothetical protein
MVGRGPSLDRARRAPGLAWLAALTAALTLLLACGGDDDDGDAPTGSITPIGTKAETATPSEAPTAGDGEGGAAPTPAEPIIDEDLRRIGGGELTETIAAGATYSFDPLGFPLDPGEETPPCASFGFTFTWQVVDPYPPDSVDLAWQLSRMGGPIVIASGPSGGTTVGCGLVDAANRGQAPITVAVRYVTGTINR